MAQIDGNLMCINRCCVFSKEVGKGSELYDWFISIPQSALLNVRVPRTVARVEVNGEAIGTIDNDADRRAIKQCLDNGWQVVAIKNEAKLEESRSTSFGSDGRVDRYATEARGYVTIAGIGPNASDEERALYEAFVNARRRGQECNSLLTKRFAKFAADYEIQDVADVEIPPKPKKPAKETVAHQVSAQQAAATGGGCLLPAIGIMVAAVVLAVAL